MIIGWCGHIRNKFSSAVLMKFWPEDRSVTSIYFVVIFSIGLIESWLWAHSLFHGIVTMTIMMTSSMDTISALQAIPAQRPVTRSFGIFFDLRLNKRLSKQSWGWWFETPSRPLWRHCNVIFCENSILHRCPHFHGNLVKPSVNLEYGLLIAPHLTAKLQHAQSN